LYRNQVAADRNWIAFELEGGCKSDGATGCTNRSAIGAQVTVRWNGQQQVQEVSGGSGFCSQNQRRLNFGLGAGGTPDKVTVRWPSGKVQELTRPEVNRVHKVEEPA
jgi:hypothetical protein